MISIVTDLVQSSDLHSIHWSGKVTISERYFEDQVWIMLLLMSFRFCRIRMVDQYDRGDHEFGNAVYSTILHRFS